MSKKSNNQSALTPEKVIKSRLLSLNLRSGYVSLFKRILLIAVVLWLVFTQVFSITVQSGNEMFPAVSDGDVLLAYRLQKDYAKGDTVIYEMNGKSRVGRVIAAGGDILRIDGEGSLYVNGTLQAGEIVFPTYYKNGEDYELRIPENSVFILGDYRTVAKDSREYGPVSLDILKGKVISLFRRRGI